MSSATHDLDSVKRMLEEAHCLEDIFGVPPNPQDLNHPTLVGVHVRDKWRSLAQVVHPDRFEEGSPREQADQVCAMLNSLYERATDAIDAGNYGNREPLFESSATILRTLRSRYHIKEVISRGDVATLYKARSEKDGCEVILKMAGDKRDGDLMLRESDALARLHRDDSPQRKHFPECLDTFKSPEHERGNIITFFEGAIDLVELRAHFPNGLMPVHAVWVLRRALSALGWAHHQGVVHGNICPEHVMIRPEDHNVWLVDWCYACIDPAKTRQGFVCVNPTYSPHEVSQRKPPLPASDIHALGKTMFYLLGGDPETASNLPEEVPEKLARLLRFMTLESPLGRAQDAWELYRMLEGIRDECFGKHRFRELRLPSPS